MSRSGTEPATSSAVDTENRPPVAPAHGDRQAQPGRPAHEHPVPTACITISRETGARGETVARLVGQRLGWEVYNHEVLEYIAQVAHLRSGLVEELSSPGRGWTERWLHKLLVGPAAGGDPGVTHLSQVVLAVGLQGQAVIVGRGAACVVPRDRALHVRLVAPLSERVAFMSELKRLPRADAERYVQETDAQRLQFVKAYFGRDGADPHLYDLVLDTSYLGVDLAADLVVQAFLGKQNRRRLPRFQRRS